MGLSQEELLRIGAHILEGMAKASSESSAGGKKITKGEILDVVSKAAVEAMAEYAD